MGVTCSCPLAAYIDFENGFESVLVKSINHGDNEPKTPVRSATLEEDDHSEPMILEASGSPKLTAMEGSIRFRSRKFTALRFSNESKPSSPLSRSGNLATSVPNTPVSNKSNPPSPIHEAAVKLQKVYKSFRTRRKLADCAVVIEQSWWKLLDFAELKHSSISFFDIDKHETAMSRWSRARTRAAKVGKGLSKNSKAQKLALQHWLEAIDPRHRYGHNLHFYYVKWLNSQSKEPFFYWLDIGEGREVNLIEKCPRFKLQQQCIKYLGPMERQAYEVSVENGKLSFKHSGELLDTPDEPKGSKWIFVLSTSRVLYVGKKKKGSFQHSSFLAGGATLAAGRIIAQNGVLKAVWPHSGHYRPTPENFEDFKGFLRENNVDLTDVKLEPIDDEEDSSGKKGSTYIRSNSSEDDLADKAQCGTEESSSDKSSSGEEQSHSLKTPEEFSRNLTNLQIPSKDDFLEQLKMENETDISERRSFFLESPVEGYETAEDSPASDSSGLKNTSSVEQEELIPEDSIFRRISSHKDMKSFQLGKQLSCRWSTGAGPRIGCVRDYPSGLQCHALEQVNLSPRSQRRLRFDFPSRSTTPNSISSLSRASSSRV